jgi:glycosyltransferase involved in cell wall biosynthesis
MRILFCNKYNYAFSGTEVYIFEVMKLLRSKGHEVALFSVADSRGQPTPYDRHFMPHADFKKLILWPYKIAMAGRAIYSFEARRRLRAMIAEFKPDVAHVRNIYHHLSPSVLWELQEQNIPVIYHVNDFKVLCPSYNFVAHGEPCEACKGGAFRNVLRQKCYPGSTARMGLAAEAYVHKWLGTYRKCVDCFLAPSQFVRDKFVEHGWDAAKFEVLPHFQSIEPSPRPRRGNHAALYFGRLSAEKGIDELLDAMQRLPDLRLTLAGDGPELPRLQRKAADLGLANVELAGYLQGEELDQAIANSPFTVFPSHAYETFGKTIVESYAHARAVIASDLGSRRELVQPGKTGLLYPPGDVAALSSAMRYLASNPEVADRMGRAGWQLVRENCSPEAHYDALIDLYRRMADRKKHRVSIPVALPQKPLRVAFIGGRGVISKYSGIETYYEEVGSRLAAMGHDVTAYCRDYFTPPVSQHNKMRLIRLPTIRTKHLETLLHTLWSTAHVLTQPCDIVHYHALGPALFSFLPRLVGKKTVVTVQGLDWQRKKWRPFASFALRMGERAAVRFPTHTMVVSQELQCYYLNRYQAETSYIPNGGILRERRSPEKIRDWDLQPGKYILFLGRFTPEKGCHLLIEAYQKSQTVFNQAEVKLVMAGASSYCDDYSRRLHARAGENIKILDWVSGDVLDELLTNAMIFVLPSDLEGLSLALLDAMGAGLCVLASDIPENREALHGAGFTFRRGNVADLADRLRFLIANPSVREAAGRTAKQRVRDHYQWPAIAKAVERVYLRMMDRDHQPAVELPRKPSANVMAHKNAAERKAG